jgi:hypothetical protein
MMKSVLPIRRTHLLLVFLLLGVLSAFADGPDAAASLGGIVGTVTDMDGHTLSGATVIAEGPSASDHSTTLTDDNGFFSFANLRPGIPYLITVTAGGFESWRSETITLTSGQYFILPEVKIRIKEAKASITVTGSTEEIATEQVHYEEQQRIFGFIPNIYVVYDQDAVPLTPKLKFRLAYKVGLSPVTWGGVGFMAGIYQASDHLNFQQGMKGYGQRFGTIAADGITDLAIGGAILPSLLHQDPRYFYQGTGTTTSRLRHAFASPFICKGDNGHLQPNYSTVGGDLISAAISMSYIPRSDRSASNFVGNVAIGTIERMVSTVLQEFVLARFTHKAGDAK